MGSDFLQSLCRGDDDAWGDFFARFDAQIRKIVCWPKWHFDAHARDDVVQNIKAGLVKSIPSLREESRLTPFVRRISVNRCIDEIRRRVRDNERLRPLGRWTTDGDWEESEISSGEEFDPVQAVIRMERAAALRRVLGEVDETCRTAIRQFYVDGLSYREMSEQQGVTVNTVGSRLARCLEKLRALLPGLDPRSTDA